VVSFLILQSALRGMSRKGMKGDHGNDRPLGAVLLVISLTFYGAMGVVSGLLLMIDPSGAAMGLPPALRNNIPFDSFLAVGLFLFTVFGLVPLTLAFGAATGKELIFRRISELSGYHWSWTGSALLVLALGLWLAVEGALIGLDYPATYMTVVLGGAVLLALMLPSTRRRYRRR